MNYTSISPEQRQEMLATIGIDSIDALFDVIPRAGRATGPLDLPPAASELELQRELASLAGANNATDRLACFAGAGAYDHFVPTFIDQIISRGEFLTAYTPYQGEASQGSLQAFFEFQTQIARLTGLDIANASLYEASSATSEAVLLALNHSRKQRVLIAPTVHPDHRRVLDTALQDLDAEPITLERTTRGTISPEEVADKADDNTACLVLQSPNIFGAVEDWAACFDALKSKSPNALAVAVFNPVACALLKNPGDCGADIAAGEGQPLGIPLQYGGPYLGLFAARQSLMRRMPGRLVGQTTDAKGRRTFCLSLQTREQHIRGQKATSNVCTNQGLLALRATMYMTAIGPRGIREVAEQCWHKAHFLANAIADLPGFSLEFDAPFFNEFAVRCPVPAQQVLDLARDRGILAGVDPSSPRLGAIADDHLLIVAVTEKRTRAELDAFVDLLRTIRA